MNTSSIFPEILGSFLPTIPTLLVCAAACVLVMSDGRRTSRVGLWALLGFGLALVLCFAMPIAQTVIRRVLMSQDGPRSMASVFSGLSFLWSLLRAATYVFLLMAVLAGRTQEAAVGSPPMR